MRLCISFHAFGVLLREIICWVIFFKCGHTVGDHCSEVSFTLCMIVTSVELYICLQQFCVTLIIDFLILGRSGTTKIKLISNYVWLFCTEGQSLGLKSKRTQVLAIAFMLLDRFSAKVSKTMPSTALSLQEWFCMKRGRGWGVVTSQCP